MKDSKLDDSTLIILASKHGQSPIDPATFQPIDDEPYKNIPGYAFHVADDAALIWLTPAERSKNLAAAQDYLERSRTTLGIARILPPNVLSLSYKNPQSDSRTPDFRVSVNSGVVYTSGSKITESMAATMRLIAALLCWSAAHPLKRRSRLRWCRRPKLRQRSCALLVTVRASFKR